MSYLRLLQLGDRVLVDGRPGILVGFSTDVDRFRTFDVDLDDGRRVWIEAGPQVEWRLQLAPADPPSSKLGLLRAIAAKFGRRVGRAA